MTDRGALQSIRRTITRLEFLQRKFKKDNFSEYIEKEIRRLKDAKEKYEEQIKKEEDDHLRRLKENLKEHEEKLKKQDPDNLDRRKKT